MIWLILFVVLGLVGLIALITAATAHSEETKGGAVVAMAVVIAVQIVAFLISSVHSVPSGSVGIVYQFGAIVGQRDEGLTMTWPWQNVKVASIKEQKQTFENLGAASRETQDVFFTVSLNYSVSKDKVQNLYRNVGSGYFDILVQGRIRQILKDEVVQYQAIEVTQKRDEIRDSVKKRLGAELEPYSITIVNLTLDDISYSDAFNISIEQKQVATQDALRAQEQVKQKEFEAQQAAAVAKGQADAQRIRAQGEADANALVNASLTDKILQNNAINKLADNIQIALVPSGQGMILDPSTILTPKK